ncbi:MAG: hypothetical protein GEEBNDBF_00475 [bacterium]|nr:hypothetical protein [bacterium]
MTLQPTPAASQHPPWSLPTFALGLAALMLGGTVAWLGYAADGTYGAGSALLCAMVPLLWATLLRAPVVCVMLGLSILALNCFGFLTTNAVFFRAVSGALIILLVIRAGVFSAPGLRTPLLLAGVCLAGTLITLLLHPGMEAAVLGAMWVLPFLGLQLGAGILERWPDQVKRLWYGFALTGGIGIALVNLYQWMASGFLVKSYVISGPFLNANLTASMLLFFVPLYLSMLQERDGYWKLPGLAGLLMAVMAELILVSRLALGMTLMAPLLFLFRRSPAVILTILLGVGWMAYIQTGIDAQGFSPEAGGAVGKVMETYRLTRDEGTETARAFGYTIAMVAISNNRIDGYGFGAGREVSLAVGFDSYGPENLWLRNWLEGGIWLGVPTILFSLWVIFAVLVPGVRSGGVGLEPHEYALIVAVILTQYYYAVNGSQTHMPLRLVEAMALGMLVRLLPAAKARASAPEAVKAASERLQSL